MVITRSKKTIVLLAVSTVLSVVMMGWASWVLLVRTPEQGYPGSILIAIGALTLPAVALVELIRAVRVYRKFTELIRLADEHTADGKAFETAGPDGFVYHLVRKGRHYNLTMFAEDSSTSVVFDIWSDYITATAQTRRTSIEASREYFGERETVSSSPLPIGGGNRYAILAKLARALEEPSTT